MKKHLSVMMLAARSSIYKVLAVITATGIVQAVLFYLTVKDGASNVSLETALEDGRISWAAGAGFVALCVCLSMVGTELGSRLRYTVRRLSVSERVLNLWWSLYYCGCFALFWLSQSLVMNLLCRWYMAVMPEGYYGPQSVFLAFYRDMYLHGLMPMAETSVWVRNILFCIVLGISAAEFACKQRRGRKSIGIFVMAFTVLVGFSSNMGGILGDVAMIGWTLVIGFACLAGLWGGYDHELDF